MQKPIVITISGVPGSGTTTIAKMLSDKLEMKMIYIGEIFRELAKEYNMTLMEFGELATDNPKIDKELDARQVKYAKLGNIVLEGRLSGWMVKKNGIKAFKVLLTADLETRINRVMNREGKSYRLVRREIEVREQCELDRYIKLYDINYQNPSYYDLIIDTSNLTPEQIIQQIIEKMN
jgi:predicted cytidylate kinase